MKKTKFFTSITAVILAAVLLFVTIVTINNNTKIADAETAEASVRTVELSQDTIDAQSLLDEFDDATLTTEGSTTYFEGNKAINKDDFSTLNYINDTNVEELTENYKVFYKISFNSESSIVNVLITMEYDDSTNETEVLYGAVFTNEYGNYDAVLCSEDMEENVLLSELQGSEIIDNVSWFSRIVKSIVIVIVASTLCSAITSIVAITYVATTNVLAETNYSKNKQLNAPTSYIYGQGQYAKWRFGSSTISKSGCGIVALYNTLLMLGTRDDFATLIHDVEGNYGALALGLMGVNPAGLTSYLKNRNISTSTYYSLSNLNAAISNMSSSQCLIMCYFTDSSGLNAHYISAQKTTEGKIIVYNLYNSDTDTRTVDSVNNIIDDGRLIMGFMVG